MNGTADLAQMTPLYIQTFALMFVRVATAVFTLPVLGNRSIPSTVKVGLAGLLTFVLLPLQAQPAQVPAALVLFVVWVGKELLLGALIGFAAYAIFSGIQMAGQITGYQMGLTFAASVDPVNGAPSSVVDQFYALVAALVFLVLDGHHLMIIALQRSFELVPLGAFAVTEATQAGLVSLVGELFDIALRISLPIAAALLLTDLAFLLLGKMAPQMNLFMAEGPLKLLLGFVVLLIALPTTIGIVAGLIQRMPALTNAIVAAAK